MSRPGARKRGLRRHQRPLERPDTVTPERWVAWRVISRCCDDGAYADRALRSEADRANLQPPARRAAQMLAAGAIERLGSTDAVIAAVGKRSLDQIDPPLLHALRLGVFQLCCVENVAEHAAVDQSVEIVRAVLGERPVPFANAVLRRAQAQAVDVLESADGGAVARAARRASYPAWIINTMMADHGAEGLAALEAQNRTVLTILGESPPAARPVPVRLRVEAAEPGVGVAAPGAGAAALAEIVGTARHLEPGSRPDGTDVVGQSLASMLVACVVDPQPGEQILDMCAAPGSKTLHLADLQGAPTGVTAVELHENRAAALSRRMSEAGVERLEVVTGDATDPSLLSAAAWDRVLVDAPCSGLGVMSRRPDLRWSRSTDDVSSLVQLQARLLDAAVRAVRPGGVIVYSTCTLNRAENEEQVAALLERADVEMELDGPLADIVNVPHTSVDGLPGAARTWPQHHDTDGFFIARLRRRS